MDSATFLVLRQHYPQSLAPRPPQARDSFQKKPDRLTRKVLFEPRNIRPHNDQSRLQLIVRRPARAILPSTGYGLVAQSPHSHELLPEYRHVQPGAERENSTPPISEASRDS